LTIFPNTEASLTDRIFRLKFNKWFALKNNFQIHNNAEEWILGKPNSVSSHLEHQTKYGEWSPENIKSLKELEERAIDGNELNKIIKEVGTFAHQKVADKVKELRKKSIYKDDPEMEKTAAELTRIGFVL
jgi:valyl-tRNA synthetase